MDDDPTSLDHRRGTAGRRATDLRRLRARMAADQAAVRASQSELEALLGATPASSLADAIETARYLLELFADGAVAADPSRRRLIARTLADLDRLGGVDGDPATQTREKRAVGRSGRGGSGRGPATGGARKRPPAGVVTAMEAHRKPVASTPAPADDADPPGPPGDETQP